MGWEALFTALVILVVLGSLAVSRAAPDVILIGGVTLLLLAGVLSTEEALAGMSNSGMITVGVLYVVVAGTRETGGISWIVERFLGRPRSVPAAQTRLMAPVISVSAFLNNTPVVAMLIPAVKEWASQTGFPVSKLMIPLSYAAILGGTCTLIGTSTNIVVYGLMLKEPGLPELGMFDITWVGVPAALVGVAYFALIGRRFLPDRDPPITTLHDPREYTVEMIVQPGSTLVGKTIEEARLRNLPGMFLMEIDREDQVLPAVSPQERLCSGDRLVFCGIVDSVVDLQKIRGLEPATDQVFKLDSPRSQRCLIEAVVSNSCDLVGRTIREGRFRTRYNAVVIAVARNGQRIKKKIGDIVLQPGDTLLLEAHPSFFNVQRNSRDFYLTSRVDDWTFPRHERSLVSLAILLGMVATVALGWLSMLKAAMLAAGLMLITRCCSASAARRSVDWQVLLVIASAFALGRALEKTGLAGAIAGNLIMLAGQDPWICLALVYLATTLFTELITNNAAVVLIFPIALATSRTLGVDFVPFAITIMMGASASFATPIGYQTNLMVYGPGGYRFTDYFKVGAMLNVLLGITTVVLAPLAWPF